MIELVIQQRRRDLGSFEVGPAWVARPDLGFWHYESAALPKIAELREPDPMS